MRRKLQEAGLLAEVDLFEVPLSGRFTVGPFELELIGLTHSIPEPNAIVIRTRLGTVLHVDRFGNLVTDLTPDLLNPRTTFRVEDADAGPLRRTFAEVQNGGLVAYLGSGGTVELAVRGGSASRRLGVGVGGTVRAVLG